MVILELIGGTLGLALMFAVGLYFQITNGRIQRRITQRAVANARAARQRANWYRAQQNQNPAWGGGQYPGGGQYGMPGPQPGVQPQGSGFPGQPPSSYPPSAPYPPQGEQPGYAAPPPGYGQPSYPPAER